MSNTVFNKLVKQLKPSDFDNIHTYKLKNKDCTFVMFYVDWCGHCQRTKPEWNKLARMNGIFDVAAFDCETYKDHLTKIRTDAPNMIPHFPTLILYKKGVPIHIYEGERKADDLMKVCMKFCN